MVRGVRGFGDIRNNPAASHTIDICRGHKDVVEPDVGIPSRKCKTMIGVQSAIAIDISLIEHYLYRSVRNPPAEHHCKCPVSPGQPLHIEQLARRKSVEVADEQMKSFAIFLYAPEQGANLTHSAAFGVIRVGCS